MNVRLIAVLGLLIVIIGGWTAAFVIYRAAEVGELVSHIAPVTFDRLTLIAVGTGGSYENPERLGPSVGVGWDDHVLLVDCGRGIGEALRKAGISVSQPGSVLITNLMPLNTIGLDDLLITGWLRDRKTPLRVFGPPGTRELVNDLLAAHRVGADALGASLPLAASGREIAVEELSDGARFELAGLTVSARTLPGGPLPALAYRFEHGGRSAVVSGTGWGEETLEAFAKHADLLAHEGALIPDPSTLEDSGVVADPERLRAEAALHTSLLEVGALATRARVAGLMLIRLQPPPFFDLQVSSIVGGAYSGKIYIPEDGEQIEP